MPCLTPELTYLKRHYREHFQLALRGALDVLSPRQRTLLELELVDGLQPAAIAAIYNVHRTTVVRWIASVRDTLAAHTRKALMLQFAMGTAEVESVLRLIQSELPTVLSSGLKVECESVS